MVAIKGRTANRKQDRSPEPSGPEPSGKSGRKTVRREAHWIEWATGILCALLVVAMMGAILSHALTGSDVRPELQVTVTDRQPVAGGYQISFIVSNTGKRTAADVPVRGEIRDGDRVLEAREITFDYVPALSNATGVLLFRTDPASLRLDLGATGYTDP